MQYVEAVCISSQPCVRNKAEIVQLLPAGLLLLLLSWKWPVFQSVYIWHIVQFSVFQMTLTGFQKGPCRQSALPSQAVSAVWNPKISHAQQGVMPYGMPTYRGYRGRVVSSTNSDVRMELEAQYKTVTVKREQLKGQEGMAASSSFGRPRANVPPWQAGRTPLHPGAATPIHGSATPLHPSATPLHPGTHCLWLGHGVCICAFHAAD